MTERAIEAAARAKYEQGDEYYGTWDDLDPVLQEYAISLTTIEIRAYLNALAEDDAAVEAVARAMCVANGTNPDWPVSNENHPRWTIWEPEALAALRALKETKP